VLFKTSLNTGWDCPRAETMVSFRTAKDETNIAQLVGRMVRAPLARRVEDNEHLNTVALYLPYYDRDTVEKVIARLTSDPDNVPPTMVRDGRQAVTLTRAENKEGCFKVLASLPTYVIPRIRPMRPVPRLAKLAALLNELGWESDPVKIYRSTLVKVLLEERKRLAAAAEFKSKVDENAMLDIRRRRVAYAAVAPDNATTEGKVRAKIADQNIDDLYAEAGRFLGEGLHKEYLRTRRKNASKKEVHDSAREKLELHALVTTDGVLDKVNAAADALRKTWTATHKGAVKDAEEKSRQIWRDIEGGGIDPERTVITPPSSIEGQKGVTAWRDHVYVDASGAYCEDFTSSWESRALATELGHREVVGWLRNQDRKPWSLCVKRRAGAKWVGIYPDFIIFRATGSGIVADIVDPHLLNDKDAPDRAKALAQYAADHSDSFGRIELLIYENASDTVGKRLDVMDEGTRKKVASVSSHEHLRQLFDSL
jgi:type III restriction enzyme